MNKKRRSVPGIRHYDGPAGGWGALKATAIAVRTQMDTLDAPATLLRTNQPDGFDCPGCAWPDKEHKSTFQFCASALPPRFLPKTASPRCWQNRTLNWKATVD